MVLSFGVIPLIMRTSLKFKKEIRVMTGFGRLDSCHGLLKNYKYYRCSLNTFFLYFFLLLKIGTLLDLILIFMISIHVSIIS
jgi:hypothetical protein